MKTEFLKNPEAVYQQYALSPEELTALRAKDFYRLLTFGVSVSLLATFSELLGYKLNDFAELLTPKKRGTVT